MLLELTIKIVTENNNIEQELRDILFKNGIQTSDITIEALD